MTVQVKPRSRLGNQVRLALLMAATAPDVLKLLKKVGKPSEQLKGVIGSLTEMAKSKDGETPDGLRGVLTALRGVPESKDASVKTAIKMLAKLFEGEAAEPVAERGTAGPGLGNLPMFTLGSLQAAVPKAPGVYEARLIRAGRDKAGKNWKADVLQASVEAGLYEGVPLSVYSYSGEYGPVEYHIPLSDADFAGWLVGNQVGFVRNARWSDSDKSVYATVHVTDPQRQALIDSMVSQGLSGPGLSIYCSGVMDDGQNVNAIDAVHSMDIVTFPAADGRIGVTLGAAVARVLGAADLPPGGGVERPQAVTPRPETGVEPTASEPVGQTTWKTERNQQADFFVSLGDFVRKQADAGVEVDPSGVVATYERWLGMWEAATEATFEEFAAGFWSSDENTAVLVKKPEAEMPEAPAAAPPAEAAPKEPVPASAGLPGRMSGGVAMGKDRLERLERQMNELVSRVSVVDSEALVEQRLAASGLPPSVVSVIRGDLTGRVLSSEAVDGYIDAQRRVVATLEAGLVERAAVSIEGQPLRGGADAQAAIDKILGLEPGTK